MCPSPSFLSAYVLHKYVIIVQYLNQEIEIGKMCLILSYV